MISMYNYFYAYEICEYFNSHETGGKLYASELGYCAYELAYGIENDCVEDSWIELIQNEIKNLTMFGNEYALAIRALQGWLDELKEHRKD